MQKSKLKFRVWDKIRKQMTYLDHLWLCSEYNSLCFSREEWNDQWDVWPLEMDENPDHFEVMSYLRIQDINNKDYYEGDIYEYTNPNFGYGDPKEPDCLIGIINSIEELYEDEYLFSRLKSAEITGNIFENTKIDIK